MKYFSIEQFGKEAHLYIFGDIVSKIWGEGDVSAFSFQKELSVVSADVIHVHIESFGGSVSEGWAIYNSLKAHPARIITHAEGFVASAALYPFMAGDERLMSEVSALFFHQVEEGAWGNADVLRAAADEAEKLNSIGIAAFTSVGIDYEDVLKLEKAETWLSPTEAVEQGFATGTEKSKHHQQYAQSVKQEILNKLLAKQHIPPENTGNSLMQMLAGYFNA